MACMLYGTQAASYVDVSSDLTHLTEHATDIVAREAEKDQVVLFVVSSKSSSL